MRWWEGLGTRESERPLPRPAAGLPPAADTAAHRTATNLLTATPDEAAILVAASLGPHLPPVLQHKGKRSQKDAAPLAKPATTPHLLVAAAAAVTLP